MSRVEHLRCHIALKAAEIQGSTEGAQVSILGEHLRCRLAGNCPETPALIEGIRTVMKMLTPAVFGAFEGTCRTSSVIRFGALAVLTVVSLQYI